MNMIDTKNATEAAKAVRNGIDASPATVRRSLTVGKLALALAKAQAEMKNPPKDSVNPHFKSRYADLATVRDTVLPALNRNGLSVLQLPCELDDAPALTTILLHGESGEYYEATAKLRPTKSDPQGVGSALTYMRRYALQALAGVAADEDDDGNAGSRPQPPAPARPEPVDNMAARARHTLALGQCGDLKALEAANAAIRADVEAGRLSRADVDSLRGAAKQTHERLTAK